MPVKSILQVDVEDGAFQRLRAAFDKFDQAVKAMPAAWQRVTGRTKEFATKVDSARTSLEEGGRAMEGMNRQTGRLNDQWGQMDRRVERIGRNIARAGLDLARWAGIMTGLGGLISGLGLVGLDQMAHGVAGARRGAMRGGFRFGEREAFGTAFGRLVDPESFLSAVVAGKTDITQRIGLLGAGLTPGEIEGGTTADTAVALLTRLRRIAQTTDPRLFQQVIEARRLPVSREDLLALRSTGGEEFQRLLGTFAEQRNQLGVNRDVAERWQDFSTKLRAAGNSIWATFVRGLGPLTEPLTKLAGAFAHLVETITTKGHLDEWIEKLSKGLNEFADTVGKPEFQTKIEKFVGAIGDAAEVIGGWVKWIASFLPASGHGHRTHGLRRSGVDVKIGPDGQLVPINPVGEGLSTAWSILQRPANEVFPWLPGGGRSRGDRNNNPGNIEYGPFAIAHGATGSDGRFAIFPTPEAGRAAMDALLASKNYRGLTLSQIQSKWVGNADETYVAAMSRATGLKPGDVPNLQDPSVRSGLIRGMSTGEGTHPTQAPYATGYPPTVVTIQDNTGGNVNVTTNALKN